MSAKTKKTTTGSRSMRDRGYVQFSIYLRPEEVAVIDKIAERERRNRTNVVTLLIVEALRGRSDT